jgi:hypothetical protein
MNNLTDLQFYGFTTLLALLAAPYIAVLSFFIF